MVRRGEWRWGAYIYYIWYNRGVWLAQQNKNRVVGTIVLSAIDAASQEAVLGSVQRVVVVRARAPRDAAVQHCLEYLGSEHPDFELEGSARSVV